MKKFSSRLLDFWNEDRSLTITLLLLLLFIFVLIPILGEGKVGEIFIKITYSLMMFTGILSVARHQKFFITVCIVAMIGLVANWIADFTPGRPALIAHDFGAILFNFIFAVAILMKTFRAGDINFQRIEGAIVVYLLLALVFAFIFHAVYLLGGAASFNNMHGADMKEFLYFSFTTITTTGYGDISPVHPLARSFANLEGLIGQLYPAILIARLVSMEFVASSKKREKNESAGR